ncbi:MAG: SUMF1/EgtB/PvdO family nonheme iron enzyme, partial [bacterium]|nr:SUMF1/EgtB/PvdO family nonheme iron enzyme [bacterium]
MTNTANVSSQRDIHSRDIITGLKIDNLTVVMAGLDDLSRVINQGQSHFRLTDTGCLEALAGEQPRLSLPPHILEAFKQLSRATDLSPAERHRAYAGWLLTRRPQRPVQRVAARESYIDLSGHFSLDWEDDPLQPHFSWLRSVGQGPERRIEREQLEDVTQAVQQFSAFVLLGPPGSGKSTVLERLLYTAAGDYLAGRSRRLPLLVTLAGYHWQRHQPLEFIRANWAALVAGDFVELARSGQALLLVDGLNEMARLEHAGDRSHRAAAWKRFLDDYFAEESPYSSRAVIASRDAGDYEQRLGLPRVEIDPLTPAQVEQFALAYLPNQARPFLAALADLKLDSQAANPFSLYILTQLYDPASGDLPPNRGRLFAGYAARLLSVMYKLADKELQTVLLALAHLGYQMQLQSESTILPAGQLQALLPATVQLGRRTVAVNPADLFDRACRAGLLTPDPSLGAAGAYKFSHQLLQEQFAAQHLLVRWQAGEEETGLWRTFRTPPEMPTPEVGEWDPLPPPPPTGWEQTTILAAGMLAEAGAFVRAVLAASPALAGRCLAEGQAPVAVETQAAVQQGLLDDLGNPALHRRARIQAGRVLGQVGDPRFETVTLNGVSLILPDFIEIPGGVATLGSNDDEAYDDEQPVHQVEIAPFYLARYPVVNAEYRCFIQAGGYNTERYWLPTGWQWRQGELEESGPLEQILETRQQLLQKPKEIERWLEEGLMTPDYADTLRTLIQLSEAEVRQQLSATYAPQAHEQPHYWTDPAYN